MNSKTSPVAILRGNSSRKYADIGSIKNEKERNPINRKMGRRGGGEDSNEQRREKLFTFDAIQLFN